VSTQESALDLVGEHPGNRWRVFSAPLTPSLNEVLRWPLEKWKARGTVIQKIAKILWAQRVQQKIRSPITPAEVLIVREYDDRTSKPLDGDNFPGGCKFLIDALKQGGVIKEDGPTQALFHFYQLRRQTAGCCRTLILVREWHNLGEYREFLREVANGISERTHGI
jgi:hypothetical protein